VSAFGGTVKISPGGSSSVGVEGNGADDSDRSSSSYARWRARTSRRSISGSRRARFASFRTSIASRYLPSASSASTFASTSDWSKRELTAWKLRNAGTPGSREEASGTAFALPTDRQESSSVALPLSVVVVAHDMGRELPRTLQTLSPGYQRDIDADDFEVVLVDNGSPRPLDEETFAAFPGRLRSAHVDPAPPSPARAANLGLDLAEGELVGLIVDGARMASPGLLGGALLATRLADCPIIAAPGYHLGLARHMQAGDTGHDQDSEDRLLASIEWEHDGYRLFEISTLAGSSGRGWFGPMGESSALFMPRAMWRDLDGLDERFQLPGGGLVNHDLYRRACGIGTAQLIVLLGEGTFHQFHGGVATSRRLTWEDMHTEYEALRGVRYRPPTNQPLYLGGIPPTAFLHLEESVRLARKRLRRS
jgi:hypothetical protein